MNRSTLARRYLPLAVVLLVQLLIIAVVPSKSGTNGANVAAGAGFESGDFSTDGGAIDPETGELITGEGGAEGGADGAGGAGGAGGAAGRGAGGAAGGAKGAVGANPLGIPTEGDTSHCKAGKQYDPAIFLWAPPCIPKYTDKNPGASYAGVTDSTIKIIVYVGKGNTAVDEILKAQGAYVYDDQRNAWHEVVARFINKNYELYGRKVEIKSYQGRCESIPPDYRCLRNEVREMIAQEKPFAIVWNTSLASPFFAEASAAKVVNLGGWHFRDSFNKAMAPYHYDVQISGTQQVRQWAEWWCKQLNGKKAIYAGDPEIQARTRVLGVISTNDPENKKTITEDLKAALSECGASYAHEYYYAQDITTADQQRRAGVAKMQEPPESTTVLCYCDLVAPAFLYQTEEENRYYPENIIAGSGFMDSDKAARAYDKLLPGNPQCQCNNQFVNAFGTSQIERQESYARAEDAASRMWRAAGGPYPSCRSCSATRAPFDAASQSWDYFAMLATLIQHSGPRLTPANMAVGTTFTPALGGSGRITRSVNAQKNDYTWNDDMRMVYWSPTRPSSFDNEPGSYVDLYPGKRFTLGQYPSGDLVLPPKQGRGRP